ncbi:MAG: hypothetical protein KDK51_09550 [Deltaproteobacteria bacterium]|nr:hypothetical protein [Deltaproteobacteria bacterium]
MSIIHLSCVLLLILPISIAHATCDIHNDLTEQKPVQATAQYWSNARNQAGSIRFEISQMLHGFFDGQETATQAIIQAIPQKFLTDYNQSETCQALLEETQQQPLVFSPSSFPSIDALQEWIVQFSRGRQKDGKALYRQCPGKCSPQYHYQIDRQSAGFTVTSYIICGHARDKKSDMYDIYGSLNHCPEP